MRRSIGAPLTIGSVGVLLLLALAVSWQVLVWSGNEPKFGPPAVEWLFFAIGTLFFVLVLGGIVWLCLWLVQEMRLNQRQRAFLDAVTHEMKTPLASFRLYLDTLQRHDPSPEQREAFLTRMLEDVDRLDHTVDQVLAAARADERGRASRRRERVELVPVLERCIERVREDRALPDEALSLRVRAASPVRANAAELELVFRNLISNAVDYSSKDVDVRVGVDQSGDGRVRVEIADNGIGIAKHELGRIFKRFYRSDGKPARGSAGLGLGLFIARSLLRRQGGRISAASDGVGHGSRFIVTLRAAPPLA